MKSILKIIGVLFGGILSSCGLPSHDTDAIKNEMKNFIETESGREFVFSSFNRNITEADSDMNIYYGRLHAADDDRVMVTVGAEVKDDDQIVILDREEIRERYRKSQKQAVTTDACDKVVRKYFQPELVQAKLWSEQENFHINIYLKEPLDQEKMGKEIYPKFKQMVEEIKQTVLNPQETYFTINLHLFENEFNENRVDYKMGTYGSEPVGDYHFKFESSSDDPLMEYQTRVGFGSGLDVKYKKMIQKELNITDKYNVLHDFQPNAFWFPEDIDENGIRMYQRYFASIWDAEKKEVIDRKFVKINVFNDKMEWYEVEKFPR